MEVRRDCFFFRGDRPCDPHKEKGWTCTCDAFVPRGRRILVIKLGAAGDVVRTTPLLRHLRRVEPYAEVTWITHHPEFVRGLAARVLPLGEGTLALMLADRFDLAVNLDKDPEACALLELVTADEKRGFGLRDGRCFPLDAAATAKFETGVDDDLNRAHRLSYPAEALSIAGLEFAGEEYLLPEVEPAPEILALPALRIGLNTGCGLRWTKRRWPAVRWRGLVAVLRNAGLTPVLLGGPEEDGFNRELAHATGALYPGVVGMERFSARIRALDGMVSLVTLAAHLAIGHAVPLVLLNNLFNRHEFELYGRGEIVEPEVGCLGCYTLGCPLPCMETVGEERVMGALRRVLS